jgi:hypothetical protein
MRNYRPYYRWISLIILAVGIIIAWTLNFYKNEGELVALIDVTLTSIALIIAILEILMVRNITESSNEAVKIALVRISEIFSISDISKGIKIAYDIQKYLRSTSYIIAHLRMQDLKSIVIPLKNDNRFKDLEVAKKLPDMFSTLSIDINNIDLFVNEKKKQTLDISKINSNLEELVSILLEFENHIKTV